MRLLARMGLMGLVVLVGRPVELYAKPPRDAAVVDAEVAPGADLNEILRQDGWTVLKLPNNIYAPGKLFRPGSTSSEGTCVDATPITGDLPSIQAQGSKGFVVDVGASRGPVGGSVAVQATSFKLKSTTDVEQAVIEGMDMKLNDKCLEHLQALQARGTSLEGWVVIQETARARVKEIKCSSREAVAKVRAMWIARGEIGEMSDCVQSTEVAGVIAYKARAVTELLPGRDVAPALLPAPVVAPAPPPAPDGVQVPQALEQGPPGDWVAVSAGGSHTCGVTSGGSMKCWGYDTFGAASPPTETFKTVSTGGSHTCGVTTTGSVKCWGYRRMSRPPSGAFKTVSAGVIHTCGVTADDSVKCWGVNKKGQARPPSDAFGTVSAGMFNTCGVTISGSVKCWGSNEEGQSQPPAGTFTTVSVGGSHTCGVTSEGPVKCWGTDKYGQSSPPAGSFRTVSAGHAHTCGVTSEGGVMCWGRDNYRQSSAPSSLAFKTVSAGHSHTCGVTAAGSVKCWGHDQDGRTHPPN